MQDRVRAVISSMVLIALVVVSSTAHAQDVSISTHQADIFRNAVHFGPDSDSVFPTTSDSGPSFSAPGSSGHGGIGIGIKGGWLLSTFTGDGLNYKNRDGLMGGIFIGGNRHGVVGVMGEIMYAKKGAKNPDGSEVDLYYLELPVLLRINAGSGSLNGVMGYFIAGPAFDIRLKAKLHDLDVKDDFETLDVGLIVGGGVEITRIIIEARGNWGQRNIATANLFNTTKIHERSFAILFGVRFN